MTPGHQKNVVKNLDKKLRITADSILIGSLHCRNIATGKEPLQAITPLTILIFLLFLMINNFSPPDDLYHEDLNFHHGRQDHLLIRVISLTRIKSIKSSVQ